MAMMDIKQRRSMMVVKPNELAQKGRNLLTGKQIDIIEYLLSGVSPQDEPEHIYIFDVKDFCAAFGFDTRNGNHYRILKQELKNIADVSCWIVEGKSRRLFRWLNEVEINEGSGQIAVSFHKTVRDYIFNINPQEGYHKYQLVNVAALTGKTGRNKYPKLVYMFLKSYAEQGGITVSLEDFRTIHCPTDYTEYKRINQRILAPSMDKINELTDITFAYKALSKEKGSKRITHIQFTIYRKKGEALKELEDKQYTAIDGAPWVELPF